MKPKWEDEKQSKKNLKKIQSNIRIKQNEIDGFETEVVQIEFDIRMGKITQSIGTQVKDKFDGLIKQRQKDITHLQKEKKLYSDSKGWVDWYDRMNNTLDKVPKFSKKEKTDFLKENIDSIVVKYDSITKSHLLDISFTQPIVGDSMVYSGGKDEKGFKKYELLDGGNNYLVKIPLDSSRKRLSKEKKEKLNNIIFELKEEKGYSHQEVCDYLNKIGLRTTTGKKWDKPKLSSYYNYIKKGSKLGK